MAEERLIKKYPNRRLYDVLTHRYITLSDVDAMVREGVAVKVVEKRQWKAEASGRDVTRDTLLATLRERDEVRVESGLNPLLSVEKILELLRTNDAEEALRSSAA